MAKPADKFESMAWNRDIPRRQRNFMSPTLSHPPSVYWLPMIYAAKTATTATDAAVWPYN